MPQCELLERLPARTSPSQRAWGSGRSVGSLRHVFTRGSEGQRRAGRCAGPSKALMGNTAPALFQLILQKLHCKLQLYCPQGCFCVS